MNAMIYEAEWTSVSKRLETVDRILAWLEAKGCTFTRTGRDLSRERADLDRRLRQIEDLSAYDEID